MFPVGQEFKAKCSLLDGIQIHAYTHTHTYITRIHTDACSKRRTKLLALYICCGQAPRFARGTLKTLQIVGDSGIPEKLR